MNAPASSNGGGFMPPQNFVSPQTTDYLHAGHYPPTSWQAINALTPSLFRAASEQRANYGSTHEASLVNLLGAVSFAASGNFRIRGHNGKEMPLTLHIRFAGPPLSGKSATFDRFNTPVIEAMKGGKKRWQFDNVTPPTLLRKIRGGLVLAMLGMAEGRGHLSDKLSGQLSRAFQELSDLYDGHVPSFDRADDDDEEVVANAPDSAIFVTCVNVQNDAHRVWLDKHAQDAIGSGYLFRVMMMETEEIAVEGAGSLQPEVALLDYDQSMVELIAGGRIKLEAMPANRLPVIDVMPEAEQALRQARERFNQMASSVLSPNDARVFAVRLAANTRRIAGCMHVFERYEGAVSDETMARAATIAECFGGHWLASVFRPKPVPDVVQRAQRLLDYLHGCARQVGLHTPSCRRSDIETLAPNFGWTKAGMSEAISLICGQGFAQVVPRIEDGRRVIKLELIANPEGFLPGHQGYLPPRLI
jgi:hypothetical protein